MAASIVGICYIKRQNISSDQVKKGRILIPALIFDTITMLGLFFLATYGHYTGCISTGAMAACFTLGGLYALFTLPFLVASLTYTDWATPKTLCRSFWTGKQ